MRADPTAACAATHPHDDHPCVVDHPHSTFHRTAADRAWRQPHACTMCPVRDADGRRLPAADPGGDVPL